MQPSPTFLMYLLLYSLGVACVWYTYAYKKYMSALFGDKAKILVN